MFEAIGILATWLVGLALALIVPIYASGWIARALGHSGDGLSELALGWFFSRIAIGGYVIGTVAYLALT